MPESAPTCPVKDTAANPKRGWWLKRIMIYILIIYLAWLVIGFTIQRSILFPRSMAGGTHATFVRSDIEVFFIESPQGPVEAWFIPGDGVSDETPGPLVIFAHGNGELIDNWPDMLREYRSLGFSVLLPEFRGYGRSAGTPSQKAIGEDYTSFYDLVIERPDVDATRVVIHGRSIGGGGAVQLAADRPSAAMILQSSPSSIRPLASRLLLPGFLVRDPFNSVPVIRDYPNPVLVMHGSQDHVIPPSHATRLADTATHPTSRLILYDSDHNTVPPSESYWDDIEQFLKDAGILE
jgi:fermentation-respiration switch protein FrsA (DUF1100 family)